MMSRGCPAPGMSSNGALAWRASMSGVRHADEEPFLASWFGVRYASGEQCLPKDNGSPLRSFVLVSISAGASLVGTDRSVRKPAGGRSVFARILPQTWQLEKLNCSPEVCHSAFKMCQGERSIPGVAAETAACSEQSGRTGAVFRVPHLWLAGLVGVRASGSVGRPPEATQGSTQRSQRSSGPGPTGKTTPSQLHPTVWPDSWARRKPSRWSLIAHLRRDQQPSRDLGDDCFEARSAAWRA
jgi:hypothetical protein